MATQKAPKPVPFTQVRLWPEIEEIARKLAESDHRTLTQMTNILLHEAPSARDAVPVPARTKK